MIEREFNERLNDFYADLEAQMSNASEDEELPEPTKGEILQAKEKLSRKE